MENQFPRWWLGLKSLMVELKSEMSARQPWGIKCPINPAHRTEGGRNTSDYHNRIIYWRFIGPVSPSVVHCSSLHNAQRWNDSRTGLSRHAAQITTWQKKPPKHLIPLFLKGESNQWSYFYFLKRDRRGDRIHISTVEQLINRRVVIWFTIWQNITGWF